MKIIEELKELKELGVSHFKTNDFEVKFFPMEVARPAQPFTPEEIKLQKESLEDELFNQGI